MVRVEYRFLQAVISDVSGDRLTVGILHWDGRALRMASSLAALKLVPEEHRETLRRVVVARFRKAEKRAAELREQPSLYGLSFVFPVREGLGAALYWTPVQEAATRDAEAHFQELKVLTHLQEQDDDASAAITNRELTSRLQMALAGLATESPARLKFANTVKHLQPYTVPVSWKNGVWHHALPLSLDGLSEREMARRVRDLVGIIQVCIPVTDVAVPVAVFPAEPARHELAREEARVAEKVFSDRGVHIFEAPITDDDVELSPLLERIRTDVRS
ncbi:MAG: hypothetical protein R3B70_20800 [Polyangiaceae bacterium]